ncbi:hypothetical protein BJY52DRAFT_1111410 [Lactarius psammicola]|nr:hypothetical protein BJY52DRAFT_1111410 [Lactarius psammicola]
MRTSQTPLSLKDAHLINAVLTIGYVLPLYFTKYTRLSFSKTQANNGSRPKNPSERWRDDPTVIKARLLSVSASMIASVFLVHYVVVSNQSNAANVSRHTTRYLGFSFRMRDLPAHFVTPMLFLGPLYGRYLARDLPFMRPWIFNKPNKNAFDWISFRNYFIGSDSPMDPYESLIANGFMQAPISEEVVWRSCIVCAYRLAGASNTSIVFFTPISFGSAHLHHVWETYNLYGRTRQALRRALLLTLFQFTYTTLFGFHSAFLLLRTGSLLPSVSAHIFCNFMGFPQLQEELQRYSHRRKQIVFTYFAGIALYIYGMRSWTLARA